MGKALMNCFQHGSVYTVKSETILGSQISYFWSPRL